MGESSTTGRRFRPTWWATLGTLLVGSLFVAAGSWQLGRATEKEALLHDFEAAGALQAMPPPSADADLDALRYRRVRAAGRYDASHQVFLDARIRDGRAGYEVLTPLVTDSGAILVNRGWVPANPDRGRLPQIAVGDGARTVEGLLDRLPRPALALAAAAPDGGTGWPRRLLYPQAAELAAALGYPLADFQLLLVAEAPEGYLREWRPAFMAPRQHLGYAVQWFALAVTLVVIYALTSFRKAA
jgi:surfeit locus 1 family protein